MAGNFWFALCYWGA